MKSLVVGLVLILCSLHVSSEDLQKIRIGIPSNTTTSTPSTSTPISLNKTENVNCNQVQNKQFRAALLQAINEVRHQSRQCGGQEYPSTSTLIWNNKLQKSAQIQAHDISDRRLLSHLDKSGRTLQQRFEVVGYAGKSGGENLANGQKTAHQVLSDWMTLSPRHCKNIMTETHTDYALACVINSSNGRAYWVQQFGSKEIN